MHVIFEDYARPNREGEVAQLFALTVLEESALTDRRVLSVGRRTRHIALYTAYYAQDTGHYAGEASLRESSGAIEFTDPDWVVLTAADFAERREDSRIGR